MSRHTADEPPVIEFHPWPRPVPVQYLSLLQVVVLLALVMALLVTVLPALSFLHLLVGVAILVTLFRRTRKQYPRREGAND
jgi:hypothetical protein